MPVLELWHAAGGLLSKSTQFPRHFRTSHSCFLGCSAFWQGVCGRECASAATVSPLYRLRQGGRSLGIQPKIIALTLINLDAAELLGQLPPVHTAFCTTPFWGGEKNLSTSRRRRPWQCATTSALTQTCNHRRMEASRPGRGHNTGPQHGRR